jgi:quercetin dioxygenase-like cupin family protein
MKPLESDTIAVGALRVRFLVEPEGAEGGVSVFECVVPADAKVPAPHSHDAFDETIYGLEGASTWTVDGATLELGRGQALRIPRGAVHGFDNRASERASFLAIATPGVVGPAYFHELGAGLTAAAGGPPDREAVVAVMRRHGLSHAAA